MIDLAQLDFRSAVMRYMLANTPRYLYRHLRSDPTVTRLAQSFSPRELLIAVSELGKKPDRSSDDVAIAYAMLVSLSLQDYRKVREALEGWLPMETFKWANDIISIGSHMNTVTNISRWDYPRGHVVANTERDDTPSNVLNVDLS